jgi:putative hydrolase of the HAD superfamily
MILIFDLDDTLYREETYAISGFEAVAKFVSAAYGVPFNEAFDIMQSKLRSGERDQAFQALTTRFNLPRSTVKKCLSVYRSHKPNIFLDNSAAQILNYYSNINKYLVTDGNKLVQRRKVDSLELQRVFKYCFVTHSFGLKAAKTSIICFEKIRKKESVEWTVLVYIGDDPKKDFVNLKPLGVKTIRVLTGRYSDLTVSTSFDAEFRISSLGELKNVIDSIYGK